MRHIIPISGKDSLATAIVQMAREPGLPYEFLFNDTRMELPATYEWLEKVESVMGIEIIKAGKSLRDIIAEQKILPSPMTRYCTKYAKVFPMDDYIGEDDSTLYIGLRADENRAGAKETKRMKVSYPLQEMGVNLALVYRIVGDRGLMPPAFFWSELHRSVINELGVDRGLVDELPRWIFDRLFAWRSRPNCFMCFYQRLYEWAGLLSHEPELFSEAEELEARWGFSEKTHTHAFLWLGQGRPLFRIREHAARLLDARVQAVVKLILKRKQLELFSDSLTDEMELAGTSCGFFCGK